MTDEYKSLKVPTWVYENAVAAQNEIRQHGIDALPAGVLQPKSCPRCRRQVNYLEASAEVKFSRLECPHCQYTQQTLSVDGRVVAGVGLGVLIGFSLSCLIDKMNEPERRAPKRLAAPRRRAAKRRASR